MWRPQGGKELPGGSSRPAPQPVPGGQALRVPGKAEAGGQPQLLTTAPTLVCGRGRHRGQASICLGGLRGLLPQEGLGRDVSTPHSPRSLELFPQPQRRPAFLLSEQT